MIWLLAIAAYIAIGLLTARWFYRVNSEALDRIAAAVTPLQR